MVVKFIDPILLEGCIDNFHYHYPLGMFMQEVNDNIVYILNKFKDNKIAFEDIKNKLLSSLYTIIDNIHKT